MATTKRDSSRAAARIPFCALPLLAALACTNDSPVSTSSSPQLSPLIYAEWAIAQRNLAPYVGDRAQSVMPDIFVWSERPGKLPCPPSDEPRFDGCFHPDAVGGPRIEWDRHAPSILHHESGHAILWALGDPRWDCYEHGNPADANYEPDCESGVRR
jgi:hypothetical protein